MAGKELIQMRRNRTQHTFITSLFLIVLLLMPLWGMRSSAHRTEDASESGPMISPAGALVLDATTRQPAVGSLPVDFVRSPDHLGPEGGGRYLVSVNSGFGIQFNAAGNRGQQSLSLIDLNVKPAPLVVQNVYFPSPQSVNVGVVFSNTPDPDGSHQMFVSGGFENKIWIFRFMPGSMTPITPAAAGNAAGIEAPSSTLKALPARRLRRAITIIRRRSIPPGWRLVLTATTFMWPTTSATVSALSKIFADPEPSRESLCPARPLD
jgi:hypothetical protein